MIKRMFVWSPSQSTIHEWSPEEGWNGSWTEKEKIQCTRLYFFFHTMKHYSKMAARTMAYMLVCKEKYHGLQYSEEQERMLEKALHLPFTHSATTSTPTWS